MSVRATISESKSDFHKEFPYVIPAIYRKLADELLVELHLLSHQKNFRSNSIFAIGLKEIFNKFTNGYRPSEHISQLFNAICNCNGFNPSELNNLAEQLINNTNSFTNDSCIKFLTKIKDENKDMNYYSRISAIGIYKLTTEFPYCKSDKTEVIDKEIIEISKILGFNYSRVEKDISMFKSNIEKMKQALEIIKLNITSTK